MRENLIIETTKNTPEVVGLVDECSITFSGSSFPEDVRLFYDPIVLWIEDFSKDHNHITINCRFYYLASSSVIAFIKLLKKTILLFDLDKITVNWQYEEGDDDILKIGEDYSQLINLPFNFQEEKEKA